MTTPSAADALLSLAAELTGLAEGMEHVGTSLIPRVLLESFAGMSVADAAKALRLAARMARTRAAGLQAGGVSVPAETPAEPGQPQTSTEGGEPHSAAQSADDGKWWLEPVPDSQGGIDSRHPGYRVNAVAFNILTEKVTGAGWFLPLDLRQEITRAVVAAIGPMIVTGERERIAELAERGNAKYLHFPRANMPGEYRPFADLIREMMS